MHPFASEPEPGLAAATARVPAPVSGAHREAPSAVRRILLAAVMLTTGLFAGPVAAQTTSATESDRSALVVAIDSMAEAELREGPAAGLSVAVVQGADTIVAKGYGYADLELDVPMPAGTVHRLGSITKQFTAAAVLKLIERNEIRLDAPMTEYLPDYPTQGHTVTVHHLLNHTSGIKSYTGLGEEFWERSDEDLTHDELLALVEDEPFDFAPGDDWRYNNTGYYLLGVIIEEVTGDSYGDHLRTTIFEPLGLDRTLYCYEDPIVEGRAEGYRVEDGELMNDEPISMNTPGAAGALCSTTFDLLAWNRALHGGRVLSPESYERMTAPTTLNEGREVDYGYGIAPGELGDHRKVSHGGGINGFATMLSYYPDDDLSIVVLANTESPAATRLEEKIARRVLDVPGPVVTDLPLEPEQRARYVGRYRLEQPALEIRIFEQGDRLMAQATGQSSFPLLYQGEDAFIGDVNADIRLVFELDGDRATGFVLHQGGQAIPAQRIES